MSSSHRTFSAPAHSSVHGHACGGGIAMTADVIAPGFRVGGQERADGALPSLPGVSSSAATDFAALYTAEFGRLAGYLTALTGDVDSAREAAQEAFTRLFARWRSVREPRAFVYVVATNLCRHSWKQNGRERAVVTRLGQSVTEGGPEHDPWLRDLVERLPVRHREVVLLHYYADLPVAEITAAIH